MTRSALPRRALLSAAALGLALGLAPAQAQQQPVNLGFLGSITGPIAQLVPPIVRSSQLAVEQINAQGGILGGRRLNLIVADDQCNAQGANDGANKLVNVDQVTAIVGALCSGATIAAANSVAIPNGVVMISPASTSPAITALQDRDLIFRVAPSDAYQGQVLAKYVMDKGLRRVALTWINNDYGRGFSGSFRAAYERLGGTITAAEAHEPNQASYRATLATLGRDRPEALVLLAYAGGTGLTLIRQSLEGGFFNRFVGGDGMRDDVLIREIGAANLNILITQPVSLPGNTSLEVFNRDLAAVGGNPQSIFVAQGYDATFLLALAIQRAGSTDRAAISRALRAVTAPGGEPIGPGQWAQAVAAMAAGRQIKYAGASGSVDFDENGDVPGVIAEFTVQGNAFVQGQRLRAP
jgi:branched-chain amino acid transport system substrate-binding protein